MYTLKDPVSKTTVGFSTIVDARRYAYTIIDRRIQKSVTIKYRDHPYGKVYESARAIRGILYKGAGRGDDGQNSKPYVLGSDGTLLREFDGSW